MSDPETRRDVQASLAARHELGPEFEADIAAGLADRVEQLVALRTAELRVQTTVSDREHEARASARTQRFVIGIISLGTGVPITAIAATNVEPGLLGVAVGWAGIVGVNLAHAWGQRRS